MLVTYDLTCEDAPIPFAQSAWNYVLVLVLAMLGCKPLPMMRKQFFCNRSFSLRQEEQVCR